MSKGKASQKYKPCIQLLPKTKHFQVWATQGIYQCEHVQNSRWVGKTENPHPVSNERGHPYAV